MPKPQDTPSGSFSDLYDAMQQRRPASARNGHASPEPDAPPPAPPAPAPAASVPVPATPHESSAARKPASKRASVLAPDDEQLISTIRRTVRVTGKEVVYVRLTAAEKAELADIVYAYKRRGQKTTDTEVGRIAVNYIIHDYKTNGDDSILARVLASLLD